MRTISSYFPAVLLGLAMATSLPAQLIDHQMLTELDRYVKQEDATYQWDVVSKTKIDGATFWVIDLKSQTWRKPGEVDRTVWQHWLTIVQPDVVKSSTALFFIGGGSNDNNAPTKPDGQVAAVAAATQTIACSLRMIPNQPLVFHSDGKKRYEDDLIGYTWDQFLKTNDPRWPARLPMVKAVVRGMDTVQAALKKDEAPSIPENFVVAGGSKRGWTTWMTAAVDDRVKAIMPIVIDVLNVDISMRHHFAAYGFWAPAVGDYVQHQIPQRRDTPRYQSLMELVDPFAYRSRLTMPKCIINASGDQFFLPDSSQFYFDGLPGEKHLCYVPNADHSLRGSNALDTVIAFHHAIAHDLKRPTIRWEFEGKETIHVHASSKPAKVTLWQAVNPEARDFRVEKIGRTYKASTLNGDGNGSYTATVEKPDDGWKAYFVQLQFDIGAPRPIRLSTPVRVTPDVLPFADVEAPRVREAAGE